ncbi:hypothetical protein AYK24_06905 [Thermoplasmatales archaeon SG8-52-4]|nr:MAG: hypothetical protein AYK24_06905 [Thermoplasmatales archaeon SG8-52-4]
MKKEDITLIEIIKCPDCKKEILLEIGIKSAAKSINKEGLDQWFRIREAIYLSSDSVRFIHEPPQPTQCHKFRCVDKTGTPKTQEYEGKFWYGLSDPLVVDGIRDLTEDHVLSGNWFWEAKKIICP